MDFLHQWDISIHAYGIIPGGRVRSMELKKSIGWSKNKREEELNQIVQRGNKDLTKPQTEKAAIHARQAHS